MDDQYAGERRFQAVLLHYKFSEMPGIRRSTEKNVAGTLAWHADSTGLLPTIDFDVFAKRCDLSVRTFRHYLKVLLETAWLVESKDAGQTRLRINPTWLKGLPPGSFKTGG